ncbi:DUF4145 domain-containing protein [Rheinheimera sp.]|uniref:DUF4145 domain-containing protein n=1 Tax=Rheinheimera sp. TaxID=1869214 RepID=UPI00404857AF
MQDFSWHCPYCDKGATITSSNFSGKLHVIDKCSKDEQIAIHTAVITCPNSDCKEYAIDAKLFLWRYIDGDWRLEGEPLMEWALKPNSHAKQFPEYVPKAILSDYEEACLIRDLSPKASATLSRRCLQGMIRDFFDVKEKTLYLEISAIREKVESLTWDAIDAVRSIGNIGAHMEKDINLIIDVDANEAGLLIGLIESLIQDWYVARHERQKRLKLIVDIAESKKSIQQK